MENKKIKILAIDDNSDNLVVLQALIADAFPEAVYLTADSGRKGLDLCLAEVPDVILLDIVMPGMDGYEVCTKLKSDKKLKNIPVVMVTANRADKESRIKALEVGADAFLPKPVDESELKAQIKAMLRIKGLEDLKKNEKQHLENLVLDRTEALENELADRIKAENKLITSLDKITLNRKAILNLMEDLKSEVDERKKIAEDLKSERNLLRTLIDNIPDTFYVFDKDCRKILSNKADLKIIGYESEDEVLGKTDLEIYPGEQGKLFYSDTMNVMLTGTPKVDYEEKFISIDGETRFLNTSQYPFFDSKENIIGVVGVGHDITERKKAELNLSLRNSELQFLNKLAMQMAALDTKENMSSFLIKNLKEFSGSEFIIFSEFQKETNTLITRHVEADQKFLRNLIKLSGDRIIDSPAPINMTEQNYREIVSDIVSVKKSLSEISFGAIPALISKGFNSFTGFDRYYGLSFVIAGELFGTALMGFKKDQPSPSMELLRSFVHMAAVSLKRRNAEEKLIRSEEEYRQLIENQGEGVGVVDLKESFVFSNPAAEQMFGVEKGDLVGRNLLDFISEDNKSIIKSESQKWAIALKSTYEIDILRPDGGKRTILNTATPQFDKDGKHTGTFGVFRDITDRKLMEQKVIESETYYRTLIDISPDGIITCNMEGEITYGSIKALEIFGIPPDSEIKGSTILNWVSSDYSESVMERISDILSGNIAPETREYKLMKYDKSVFWGELSSSPLTEKNGSPSGLLIVCRDISERRKSESDLIRAKDKAEESDRLKTAFLHNISHEIRTPMNAIIGFSSLLNEPGVDAESQRSFIEIIGNSSNHLLSIVSDIIEISNVEAGLLKLSQDEVNLSSILNKLLTQFAPKSAEKGIEFNLENILPEKISNIKTDANKLTQILTNLLSNAFKFTAQGKITFGCKLKNDIIEFYVSDTGIGISPPQHKKIFDRFCQVENSVARQYEGTGLGLSIAKAYTELMGGRMWLTSEKGSGSVFYFTIPYIISGKIEMAETLIYKNTKSDKTGKKTILVAEDEETNYMLIVELLASLNAELIHAVNGKEALEICESGKEIALVLMDIKMPVMDGHTATREIRKFNNVVPIIALTAFAFEADREKALSSGCTDYLSKPVRKAVLLEMVNKYM